MSGHPVDGDSSNWGDYMEAEYRRDVQELWDNVYGENCQAMHTAEWRFKNGRWGQSFLVTFIIPYADDTVTAYVARQHAKTNH
jgi:hypothetical protein